MPEYGVSITDTASPILKKFSSAAAPAGLFKVAGEAGKRVFVNHFTNRQRNEAHPSAEKLGAKPSGLFADFARSTNWQPMPSGVRIQVSHVAARQRYQGGTIRPVNGTMLTMPANAYAYGRRAREVGVTLKFMFAPDPETGRWRPALVAPEAVTKGVGKARKDGSQRQRTIRPGGVYYWLIRQAKQKGDPRMLPSDEAIEKGITDQIGTYFDDKLKES